jgi:hypothetical protein
MVDVTDLGDSAEKLERRGSQAGQDFEAGVSRVSSSEQQDATLDARDNWEQGVQEALSEGRFEDGVRNPNKDWQTATLERGSQRFTQGISNAGDAWQTGFAPVAEALEQASLEPRGARGSETNRARMNQIFDVLSDQ